MRPIYNATPRYAFYSREDYLIIIAFGAIYEDEYERGLIGEMHKKPLVARFFEVPGAEARAFLAFVIMPTLATDTNLRLQPGDHVYLSFDNFTDSLTSWSAWVREELPFCPMACKTFFVSRPWDKEEKKYADDRTINAVPLARLSSPASALTALSETERYTVIMWATPDNTPFARVIDAFESLCREIPAKITGVVDYLVGNQYDRLPARDMYAAVRAQCPDPLPLMGNLSGSQKEAIQSMRQAGAGCLNVQGPPGTGKTFLTV